MDESTEHIIQEPAQPTTTRKKGSPILLILITIIILGLLGGGAYFLLKEPTIEEDSTSTASTNTLNAPRIEIPTAAPSPTPSPAPIVRSEVSIQVLNGTGVAGEASFLQEALEDLGYENIEVGNAEDENNTATIVVFSSALSKTAVEEITEELEDIYESVTARTSDIDEYDVEITTGLRKGQEADEDDENSLSPTPTKKVTTSPSPGL